VVSSATSDTQRRGSHQKPILSLGFKRYQSRRATQRTGIER
jgi:hypothetical protein